MLGLPKPLTTKSANRHIFDLQYCHNAEAFPGVLGRSEDDKNINKGNDKTVNECFENMGIVCNFFREALKDTSVFGNGTPLIGIVHYSFYFPGAWWQRLNNKKLAHVIVFGDGWENDPWNNGVSTHDFGGCFGNFTSSLEVVAHEMAHAYVQTVMPLISTDDPGALNEHIADVIGTMCEQWYKSQSVTEADWLIGEDLIAPEWKGVALRSMKDPGNAYKLEDIGIGKDPQFASMPKSLMREDLGGVHINSGIPNRAFYLAAMGFGGHSWDKAGKIWIAALRNRRMTPSCTFENWASVTIAVALSIFDLEAQEVVRKAWLDVGMEV